MEEFYNMIFKRKSVRKFDAALSLKADELAKIKQEIEQLIPLVSEIKVGFEIVNRLYTTAKYGEYCLLLYSENKPHYLLNAGYMLEQLDLFLTALDIGVCWYGLAKTKEMEKDGLDFVIMLAFGKSSPQDFRQDRSEFKRKSIYEIWQGEFDSDVKEAVRLAPSAMNTQSWRLISDSSQIKVCRSTRIRPFIPIDFLAHFSTIDLGICLCFLEIALQQKGYLYERKLIEEGNPQSGLVEIATYQIK
ncbi:MAG TPA: nitroreductase family protein [Bacillota bacterium]|nr:nitroreductase family protein [Bacillota bacterium]